MVGTGLALGGTAVWNKPIINQIVLPAHAQTSTPLPTTFFGSTISPLVNAHTPRFSPIDLLVETAIAQQQDPSFACRAVQQSESTYQVTLIGLNRTVVSRQGVLNIDGSQGQLFPQANSCEEAVIIPASIMEVNNSALTLQFERAGDGAGLLTLVVPEGDGELPELEGCQPSDRRLKHDFDLLGYTDAGHALYRFKYLSDYNQRDFVGLMAQELLISNPQVVCTGPNGFYQVDYAQLGMRMSTFEAWQVHGDAAVHLGHH